MIDEGPWSWFQLSVFAMLTVAFIIEGFNGQVLGSTIPAMAAAWKLAPHSFSFPIAVGWVGAGVGTAVGGFVGDRIGRRNAVVAALLLFGAPTALTALVHDLQTLSALRFLAGAGLGACTPPALALIAEYTPARRHGRAISLAMICSLAGLSGCGLAASLIIPLYGWRTLFGVIGTIPVVWALIMFRTCPESPNYLARFSRRRAELNRVLRRLGRVDLDDAPIALSATSRRNPVLVLFEPEFFRSTIGLWGGFMFDYLATGICLSWIPTMLAHGGFDLRIATTATSAWSFGGIGGTLAAGALMEIFGAVRAARLLAAGAAGSAAILALGRYSPADSPILLFTLLACNGACAAGLTTCLFGTAAELYPSNSRSTGIGAAGALGRIGAFGSSFVGVAALEFGGSGAFFCVVLCAIGGALVSLMLVRSRAERAPERLGGLS